MNTYREHTVKVKVLSAFMNGNRLAERGTIVSVSPETARKIPHLCVPVAAAASVVGPEQTKEEPVYSDDLPKWTSRTPPAIYIKRHPHGPKAELARQLIEAGYLHI